MKQFAALFNSLDQTNKTNEKLEFLKEYFEKADNNDKLWVLYLFSGGKIKKYFTSTKLREWVKEYTGYPDWLLEESYYSVGDMAETIALILPETQIPIERTLTEWIEYLENLKELSEMERKNKVIDAWKSLEQNERFVFNKIITGGFRIGISQKNLINALYRHTGIEQNILAHRLMGTWHPLTTTYQALIHEGNPNDDISKPYPFYLAYSIEDKPEELGDPNEWQAEWKWDGIRGQIIYRNGEMYVWSRGEELVTDKFPEFLSFKEFLPDNVVLDGEIICYAGGTPLPFNILQTRIGRKNLTAKILNEAPAGFIVYDILEYNGEDIRSKPLSERIEILSDLKTLAKDNPQFVSSPVIKFTDWPEIRKMREYSRDNLTEGIMLKKRSSEYQVGRKKGDWWKWKIDPFTIDAVLLYAQKGHGRRADMFTDYTFAVWDGDKLVTFAKAYSGLTDAEIKEVDSFIKKNTLEKFGPVRTVKPELVFEVAFEGIAPSNRHKSGVALRFPRIHRWRRDKKIEDADTLVTLKKLLKN